jgi:hypothetical protein
MVDGGQAYLRQSVNGIQQSIIISDDDCDALLAAIDDPTKNTLGKLCNVSRVLRDKMGVNIGPIPERDKE